MIEPAVSTLRVSDFDFDLPERLIAQEPPPHRDASRLLVLDREARSWSHTRFRQLPEHLRAGDLLVINDTRVIPARLRGRRATGGKVELLLVERLEASSGQDGVERQRWEALAKGVRTPGETIDLGERLLAETLAVHPDGSVEIALSASVSDGGVDAQIQGQGLMPVPPYIRREPDDPRQLADNERYQTIFADQPGAVAAPTAGLHFTPGLIEAIRARGVALERLTLHVGPGTFQPVRVEQVSDHRMPAERFVLPENTAVAVAETRRRGGRVVAVGTTVCRTLEARAAAEPGCVMAGEGRCDLFIHPGHSFRVVDALLTNFHLPRSTLLMLVAAFAGRETVLAAYADAVERGYRFFSYGDAMLIVRESR